MKILHPTKHILLLLVKVGSIAIIISIFANEL